MTDCDIFIIGGGINGCGVARELAGRGYRIVLAEKNDLSSGTSSWSTKLIHGGLRYLEYYEFALVRKALREREVLMEMAPHLIQPLRFILPHQPDMRPKWLIRAGLFLYDYLGPRKKLKGSRSVNLTKDEAGQILKPHFTSGFAYSDCMVDDNRLTILNARSAAELGAHILPQCQVLAAEKNNDGHWHIETEQGTFIAKMVINAGGPWADEIRTIASANMGDATTGDVNLQNRPSHNQKTIRLVRGSHIIVKKHFDHDKAYIFQNSDGRILFAIPYLDDFTLIGTTDVDHDDAPDTPQISDDEISYICREVSAYLKEEVTAKDVLFTYSGVRPLVEDGAADAKSATRDYELRFEAGLNNSWLNILGGKLTTYRTLALQVADKIATTLPAPHQMDSTAPLPGGDLPSADFEMFLTQLRASHPDCDARQLNRMAKAYGTDCAQILGQKSGDIAQGIDFGHGLYQAEVDFLMAHEWAITPEDILMRRTKLGYWFDKAKTAKLASYMAQNQKPKNKGKK